MMCLLQDFYDECRTLTSGCVKFDFVVASCFCCLEPGHWAAQFPSCGGLRQSPINIVTSKVHINSALPPFDFIGHTNKMNITVENKGHSAHFTLPQSVRLAGGALPGHYRAAQFHFHWGGNGRPGSEHTIDGERFPMELHIVHIKEPYGSLTEAEHDMAGIALLAFLFEVQQVHIITHFASYPFSPSSGSTTELSNFRLSDVIPSAKELHSYYRYVGSMTTPGCEQAVAWTLFHRTLPISSRQLDAITQQCHFWTGQPMKDIYRPTQPLDGRVVYRSDAVEILPNLILLCVFGVSSTTFTCVVVNQLLVMVNLFNCNL
uniref:Carbonic anhydrase n=1 Tax=Sphaeramia orbicularis TaxID=375764 RepID=A0A672ZK71_9TELE